MSFAIVVLSLLKPSFALNERSYNLTLQSKYQPVEDDVSYGLGLKNTRAINSNEDRFVKQLIQRYKKRFVSRYNHPSFAIPHRIATVGNAMMFGGSLVVFAGGVVVIVGLPFLFEEPSIVFGGAFVMATGAAVFTGGLFFSTLGTLLTTSVLRKKGLDVPIYGLVMSGVGLLANLSINGLVRVTEYDLIPLDQAQRISIFSALAIPVGLFAQTFYNKKAFYEYVDTLSMTPVLNQDSVSLVVQGSF